MFRRLLVFSFLLFSGCGYNNFGDIEQLDNQLVTANVDIVVLREEIGREVNSDCVIRGCVTAEDRSGNFFRSFIIQDNSGAIEIRAGFYDLNTIFPRNKEVSINVKNLFVDAYNGVLQLGKERNGEVDFIANRYISGMYFMPQNNRCTIISREIELDDLNINNYCGELVEINNLQSVDTEEITWSGNRIFKDENNNELTVVTSEYSNFADEIIPREIISLTGILLENNKLKLRDLNDVEI